MLDLIVAYREKVAAATKTGKPKPKIPDAIGKQIMTMAERLASRYNFNNYTFKNDMVMDGVENCLRYFDNFNPKKSTNPFGYFSRILYYAFLRKIEVEKNQLYIRYKGIQEAVHGGGNQVVGEDGETHEIANEKLFENITDFINRYEAAKKVKAEKNLKFSPEATEEPQTADICQNAYNKAVRLKSGKMNLAGTIKKFRLPPNQFERWMREHHPNELVSRKQSPKP